jgi:hypothetical protein
MDVRTAEALERSIEHWREVCAAQMPDVQTGDQSCALCHLFHPYYRLNDDACGGCPISGRTARMFCRGTPYSDADSSHTDWLFARKSSDEEAMQRAESAFRAAARAELAFLESLREPVDDDGCGAYFGA